MSWDISIMDLPTDASSVADIPDDFQPQPLGDRSELIAAVRDVAPSADFSDPSWGELATPDFVIEFNMGSEEVVDSMMLHVRGGGLVVDFIDALLTRLGRRAIDCSAGEFFTSEASGTSFRAWQAYRDSVVERP
ncbi:hypothetical protein [Pimelobacter sp. 30-1]|uniref:hypothetical protein n=1 Tax=Pimelobacter sp. 30-1 TaxID=2004991 RepID=UPI001C0534A3|nr:hypothetical protein [Pimelobacter sp. 30-1]MBU2693953.1 hypothetical protein [Pimelobacter sp. 30-1]